jgi:threonine dehydrogenase-like Zn-dependent dehydrogenase
VLFFGAPDQGGEARIPFPEIWRREITLQTSYGAAPADLAIALELIRARRVPVAEMITHRSRSSASAKPLRLRRRGDELIEDFTTTQPACSEWH